MNIRRMLGIKSKIPTQALHSDIASLDVSVESKKVYLTVELSHKLDWQPIPELDIVWLVDLSRSCNFNKIKEIFVDLLWKSIEKMQGLDNSNIHIYGFGLSNLDGVSKNVLTDKLRNGLANINETFDSHKVLALEEKKLSLQKLSAFINSSSERDGLVSLINPALNVAMGKRKPHGKVSIQILSDGDFHDYANLSTTFGKIQRLVHSPGEPNNLWINFNILNLTNNFDIPSLLENHTEKFTQTSWIAYNFATEANSATKHLTSHFEKTIISLGKRGIIRIANAKLKHIRHLTTSTCAVNNLKLPVIPRTLELELLFPYLPYDFRLDIIFADWKGKIHNIKQPILLQN